MCTVSIVPTINGLILTSSRDEQKARPTLAPQYHLWGSRRLWYPKDMQSGGTWLAFEEETGRIACLLNGAFDAHVRASSYRKSRGQILLESFNYGDSTALLNCLDLDGIEPFTLLLVDSLVSTLWELRWDGHYKHFKELDLNEPKIWSSATLYSVTESMERERWFREWLLTNPAERILEFHQGSYGSDPKVDIRMVRSGGLQTVSISQIRIKGAEAELSYQELP
jgi:hypothetical protein